MYLSFKKCFCFLKVKFLAVLCYCMFVTGMSCRESLEPYLRFTGKRIPLFVVVLLVGTLNFAIGQSILHVTEIHMCRSAAMLCDSKQRAATPHTRDVPMTTVKLRITAVGGRPSALPLVRN